MVQQVTRGIKIEVKQNFEGTFYKNHKIHYAFGYVVTIENRSKDTVQLNSRHWTILDSLNKNENVDGEGVIGKKPVLILEIHMFTTLGVYYYLLLDP